LNEYIINILYAVINITIVVFIGSIFGIAEILQRYENIKYFLKVKKSFLPILIINGFISLIALLLIKKYKFPSDSVLNFHHNIEIVEILWAGFGGVLFLRSYFFSIKNNEKRIEIGPAGLLQVFLDKAEKKMNNQAAALKLEAIGNIMKNVDFASAIKGLPVICTAFIDNFSDEKREELFQEIRKIIDSKDSENEKSLLLGKAIYSYCDEDILKVAVDRYKKSVVKNEINEIAEKKKELTQ
jgi:hypothetical protein